MSRTSRGYPEIHADTSACTVLDIKKKLLGTDERINSQTKLIFLVDKIKNMYFYGKKFRVNAFLCKSDCGV